MAETRPVLIAGAGPTGMTAAMELQRMGVPVRLLDKAEGPSPTSRALAVQARTVELMAQRGLADAMLAKGNRGRGVTLYEGGKAAAHIDLSGIRSRHNYMLLLSQAETEQILREHLQRHGVLVEFQTEMIAFAQEGGSAHASRGGVTVTLRKPDGSLEEVDAAYLLCAEGAHSNVRQTLGLKFPGKSMENSYALGDLYLHGAVREDEASVFLAKSGLLAVFPMGGGRFRMIASHHDDAAAAHAPESYAKAADAPAPSLEELQGLWDGISSTAAQLYNLQWSSRFRINSRVVERLQVGRVFLAGDSAHVHSPAGGQGMNTGMQDMVNLCWKLAMVYRGEADPKLLETYQAERLPVIQAVVTRTETMTDAAQALDRPLYSLGAHLAFLLLHTGAVQHEAAHVLSQTAYSYAEGPLAKEAPAAGRLHAGDQVPDVELLPGRWSQSLLDPSRFTLLLLRDQDRGAETPAGDLLSGHVSVVHAEGGAELFGEGVRYALVRPDGHLACAGEDVSEAVRWMGQWFTSGAAAVA